MSKTVLFVCPHSAAKSVLAAAYFQAAAPAGFQVQIGGTEPDDQLAPHVVAHLQAEGYPVTGYQPRQVTPEDVASAYRVISLGCSAASLGLETVELWEDVPPPSQDLPGAADRIRTHIATLLKEISAE